MAVRRDALRYLAGVVPVCANHPPRYPVAGEQVANLLAVAVPQLLARDRAADRPAQRAGEGLVERRLEEDGGGGALPPERAELRAVVAVGDPAVRCCGEGLEDA